MAKNWTLKEAVEVITTGVDEEAIRELCKRYPITAMAIAKIGCNAGVSKLMAGMPDHVTMLKLERNFKEGGSDVEEDEDTDGESETDEQGDEDLASMSAKQLYALCTKKGIKAKKYGVNKKYYLDLLQGGADEDESEEDDGADEQEENDYESMNAPDLFKLCKSRGIKAEPKKKAAEYIKLLKAADAASAEEEEEDDWDDEEEATPKAPVKKAEKSTKKAAPAKKTAKADDDDDEDWDI